MSHLCANKTAGIRDAATSKELLVLAGHEKPVLSDAFSLDGSRIVTASGEPSKMSVGDVVGRRPLLASRCHRMVRRRDSEKVRRFCGAKGSSWPLADVAQFPLHVRFCRADSIGP